MRMSETGRQKGQMAFDIDAVAVRAQQRADGESAPVVPISEFGHTAAIRLLCCGVDLNTIRTWLGHAKLDTTAVHAEIDLEAKADAIACCDGEQLEAAKPWREDETLMAFLRSL